MNAVISKPLTQKKCCDILSSFIPSIQKAKEIPEHRLFDLPATVEELFELSQFPIFDVEEGIKTTGTEDTLCDILNLMLNQSLVEDIALLKKAHAQGDWEQTQKIIHKIKGGVVYVGATRIKIACQYLERYWKSGQRDLLEQLYQQVLKVINETTFEMKQWVNANASH